MMFYRLTGDLLICLMMRFMNFTDHEILFGSSNEEGWWAVLVNVMGDGTDHKGTGVKT
jgi:hypothetical protein